MQPDPFSAELYWKEDPSYIVKVADLFPADLIHQQLRLRVSRTYVPITADRIVFSAT